MQNVEAQNYNECTSGELSRKPGVLGWLDANLEKPFLIVGMLSIITIITFQTFFRYIITYINDGAKAGFFQDSLKFIVDDVLHMSHSVTWTEETARFIFIGISYLAIPLAIKCRSNIRVDIFYDRFSPRWQKICWIIMSLCFMAFALAVCVLGADQIIQLFKYPQTTSALRIPYYIPYLIIPVAFGLMVLRLIQDLVAEMKLAGFADSCIALGLTFLLALPVLVYSEFNALPLLFGYFGIMLVIGVPVSVALGLSGLITILGAGTLPISYVATTTFNSIDSFPIMAIPFFIAAGVFMGAGGLSQRLLNLADEMLGALPGGMALATIGTCMFFAAISGSGPATVAAIGSLTIPAMVARGYDRLFSASVVAAAGAIGVMIPPSNPFVVYGVSSQVSIGKLFLGGIVPGVMTGLFLMGYAYWYSKKRGWKGEEKQRNAKTFMLAFWDAKWALMVPVIVLAAYRHREAQTASRRKLHLCDENFLRDAEKILVEEIMQVLNLTQMEATQLLRSKLQ